MFERGGEERVGIERGKLDIGDRRRKTMAKRKGIGDGVKGMHEMRKRSEG